MGYVKEKKKCGRKPIGTPEEARARHLGYQQFSNYFRNGFYFSDNQWDIKNDQAGNRNGSRRWIGKWDGTNGGEIKTKKENRKELINAKI